MKAKADSVENLCPRIYAQTRSKMPTASLEELQKQLQTARTALRDLLDVIAADDLIPETVSYMKQARAALADQPEPASGITVKADYKMGGKVARPPLEPLETEPASGDGWFDLVAHLHRQRRFSERTFGPGTRTNGVLDHIRKELREIEQDPTDLEEWIDVVLLALDGAWRAGNEPEAVAKMLDAKMTKNEARQYPDWRTVGQDKAIEHIRTPPPASEP